MTGHRRLTRTCASALLLGASVLVLSTTNASADHVPDTVSEPVFPAPGGTTVVSTGDTKRAGGQMRTYSEFDTTAFKQIAWGPNSSTAIGVAFDGAIDEPGETLTYHAETSDLPNGVARWTGSAPVLLANLSEPVYQTRLTLTATDTAETPAAIPFTRSTDLPTVDFNGAMPVSAGDNGAVLAFAGEDFKMHVLWEMSSDGVVWGPLLDVYDALVTPDPGPVVQTSFGAGFFTTPVTVPEAPTGVTGVAKSKAIVASWTAPAGDGGSAITGYTAKATPSGKTCTTDGALTCKITGLVNGTNYTVTVRATNIIGDGPFSAPSGNVKPVGKPGAPKNVKAAPKDRKLAVSWDAPASNGGLPITAYKAIASPSGKSCSTTGAKACVIGGLTNGTAYTVRVKAKNAAGFGPLSAPSDPKRPHA